MDRTVRKITTGILAMPFIFLPAKIFTDICLNGNLSNSLYFTIIPSVEGMEWSWIMEKIRCAYYYVGCVLFSLNDL